jgi:hypothetical protein
VQSMVGSPSVAKNLLRLAAIDLVEVAQNHPGGSSCRCFGSLPTRSVVEEPPQLVL